MHAPLARNAAGQARSAPHALPPVNIMQQIQYAHAAICRFAKLFALLVPMLFFPLSINVEHETTNFYPKSIVEILLRQYYHLVTMSQRRELVAICELLQIPNTSNQNDIELLRSIASKAKTELQDLPDSLAFPLKTRQSSDLLNAHEFWSELSKFDNLLKQDYSNRRQMLLNRLDSTVESFKSKRQQRTAENAQNTKKQSQGQNTKSSNELIQEKYEQQRTGLTAEPDVTLSHLLALRVTECDKLLNSVVSTNTVDCKVAYKAPTNYRQQPSNTLVNLKQIIIPDVPDRGGRTGEHGEPPKETFSRQHRGGRGGGRRR